MNFQSVYDEIQNQIDSGLIQGAVVRTSLNTQPICLGIQSGTIPMDSSSRFDIASTGKVFTASCIALLALKGKIDIDAPFTEYLPDHCLNGKCDITIRDLAAHASGFYNDKPYKDSNHEEFMRKLYAWQPQVPRRTSFTYSCGNYILLGKIANKVSGMDLDSLARSLIWTPLKMKSTTWNPPGPGKHEVQHHFPDRAPGTHNDEVCFQANLPLGNGSAFSTAEDMFLFVRDIVERKTFPESFYDLICTPEFESNNKIRSFGWDMSPDGRPEGLSVHTIHHSGWTGQTVFADPATGFSGVVLTSRTGDWSEAKKGRIRIIEKMITSGKLRTF